MSEEKQIRLRIKDLRDERHISQYALAEKLGVAQSTIGNWEAGTREPNLDTIMRIADYFGVSLDFLIGRTDIRDGYIINTPAELAEEEVTSVEKSGSDKLTDQEISAIRQMLREQGIVE